MAVERRLTEIAGPVGGKLHTARSRNDQVATDVALFTRDARAARRRARSTRAHGARCVDAAERHLDWPLPGYTHLQRAQPVYLAPPPARLLLDARARPRALRASPRAQTAALPLGAGALAGRELRHRPRRWSPRELGFDARRAELDRRRLQPRLRPRLPAAPRRPARRTSRGSGAEIVLWSSEEFGFVELPDAWTSGLVDHAAEEEPRRGRAAARQGAADRRPPRRRSTACMHALPLTYNKDLQEDKEHLFDAVDTLELCLAAARGMLARRALRPRAHGRRRVRRADRRDRRRRPARAAAACRSARRTASSPGSCATAVDVGPAAVRAHARGARRALRALDDEVDAVLAQRVVARVEGLRGRHVAGARARAARARARGARWLSAA